MFSHRAKPSPRARKRNSELVPIAIPYKGLNAKAPFAVMGQQYAIALTNVLAENTGLRTRKGYSEWATGMGAPSTAAVGTMLFYIPSATGNVTVMAAKNGSIYDVTSGGSGPWVAMAGVSSITDRWSTATLQNSAGSFLCACNEEGKYAYYNGTTWTTPTFGGGAGQIGGINPLNLAFVMLHKKRLWFIEENSTSAWYLPVDQITGTCVEFDFGSQFKDGGTLVALATWTLDSGSGLDDQLVAVSSLGDVVVYKGTDPSSATDWQKVGSFDASQLPVGRRQVLSSGGEVYILTQTGIVPVSKMISATALPAMAKEHISFNIDPLISKLMRLYSSYQGWQLFTVQNEQLIMVGLPEEVVGDYAGAFLAYNVQSETWGVIADAPYAHIISPGNVAYAGTTDGRVVLAFNGEVDNLLLDGTGGEFISCRVVPAYNPLAEKPGYEKFVKMIRATFLCQVVPAVSAICLTNYEDVRFASPPSPPALPQDSMWDVALWDTGTWLGQTRVIHTWDGASGQGFVGTAQFDYRAYGSTLLTNIDFFVENTTAVL